MLKSTAIAAVLTVGVTTVATVDMFNLFINSDGFAAETKTDVIAYNQNNDRNDALQPERMVTIIRDAVKHDAPVIDATNYVDWKNIYRA